jgi:hypothetical protein
MEEIKTMSEAEEKAVATPEQLAKDVALEDTVISYIVGMDKDGNFLFQVFGKEAGLLQLLGIHAHATRRIQAIYDDKLFAGDRITHEVGKAVATVNQKLDQVLSIIAPKTPDNKI